MSQLPNEEVLKQHDPKRMLLTNQETEWALRIKEHISSLPDINNLSDMLYAQLAIVTEGDVDEAARRATNLQNLKEELKIQDDYVNGAQAVAKYLTYFPGSLMSLYYCHPLGRYVAVCDAAMFRGLKDHEKKRASLVWCYYLCHILNPDLEATRRGSVCFVEAMGFGFNMEMVDVDLMRQIYGDIFGSYPVRFSHIKCFHTPMLWNILISMVKKVIPDEFASKFEVGCVFQGGRLDQFYTLPTPEVAAKVTHDRLLDCLKLGYENDEAFKL
jgi:hypothetical protein